MATAAEILRKTELDDQVPGCTMTSSGFFNSIK